MIHDSTHENDKLHLWPMTRIRSSNGITTVLDDVGSMFIWMMTLVFAKWDHPVMNFSSCILIFKRYMVIYEICGEMSPAVCLCCALNGRLGTHKCCYLQVGLEPMPQSPSEHWLYLLLEYKRHFKCEGKPRQTFWYLLRGQPALGSKIKLIWSSVIS